MERRDYLLKEIEKFQAIITKILNLKSIKKKEDILFELTDELKDFFDFDIIAFLKMDNNAFEEQLQQMAVKDLQQMADVCFALENATEDIYKQKLVMIVKVLKKKSNIYDWRWDDLGIN